MALYLRIIIFLPLFLVLFFLSSCDQESFFNKETQVCDGDNCGQTDESDQRINVIITFTNAVGNENLQSKFKQTVESILIHTSVPLVLYIIGEAESQNLAKKLVDEIKRKKDITLDIQVSFCLIICKGTICTCIF